MRHFIRHAKIIRKVEKIASPAGCPWPGAGEEQAARRRNGAKTRLLSVLAKCTAVTMPGGKPTPAYRLLRMDERMK